MEILLAVFLIPFGLLMLCSPGTFYDITQSRKNDSPSEPAERNRVVTKTKIQT